MAKFKHKYIFYFYPSGDIQLKGLFIFYGRVKDGKANAQRLKRKYDYHKIY